MRISRKVWSGDPNAPETAARLSGQSGRAVKLGLRPEDVDEHREAKAGAAIAGQVNSVLPVGSDQYLGMQLGAQELFFRVGKDLPHKVGEEVTLAVDSHRLHVFDAGSGASLLAGEAQ